MVNLRNRKNKKNTNNKEHNSRRARREKDSFVNKKLTPKTREAIRKELPNAIKRFFVFTFNLF